MSMHRRPVHRTAKEKTVGRKSVVSLLGLLVAACATPHAAVDVPDKLKGGPGESLAMIVPAKGVQIYECRAAKDRPGAYEWAFVAPDAELFDTKGKAIGKHYAGPHWEATDGSKIIGSLKERADAPQPDAIPWLLLTAKSVGPPGAFSRITSIQRVNTAGGVAPKTPCSGSNAGTAARVPYSADYYLLTRR